MTNAITALRARLGLLGLAAAFGAAPLAAQSLTGAGATFPAPIYTKWFDAYHKQTGIQINYQAIGSGGGIKQYTEGTVDFGASDGPMTDAQLAAVQGQVIHIPTVMGAVVITWNLPALGATRLKLDGPTIARIYLGQITRWNDAHIAALNPGVSLPAQDIIVVHRSDGSGTSYIFTDYLSKVSSDWKSKIGVATSVNWPIGLGGKGNDGVTQQVKQTDGAIGYVELIYAASNALPFADLKNAAGNFVTPSLETVTNAAASAKFPKNTDFRVSITDAPGAQAYPISSFTWLLIRPDMKDAVKARAIKHFLEWMVTPAAGAMANELEYASLPSPVVALIKARLTTLTSGGKHIK
ncbi:MAG TPA: phosphate ABC transporter substrate-binding protein PstS [Gemmatimonadales bacterium]|nr:phosphate ABC transporter substrate-binding protein PstS [Gemmatimonadales bacterium]